MSFDQRLAFVDIDASLAHARMLAAQRIISRKDLAAIERGLARIRREIAAGRFDWSIDAEDVHPPSGETMVVDETVRHVDGVTGAQPKKLEGVGTKTHARHMDDVL